MKVYSIVGDDITRFLIWLQLIIIINERIITNNHDSKAESESNYSIICDNTLDNILCFPIYLWCMIISKNLLINYLISI